MQATPVTLTPGSRQRLEELVDDPRTPLSLRTRARIVLLADDGWLNVEIAAELGVSIANVATWRNRYARYGPAGLRNKPNRGRPRQVDRPMIIAETLKSPPEELRLRRWTIKELGRHVGVAEATVARAWREYGLSPREGGALAFATQPGLSASVVEIVGLYGTAGVKAAALLLDPLAADPPRTLSAVGDESALDGDGDGDAESPGAAGSRSGKGYPSSGLPGDSGLPDDSGLPGSHLQFLDRVVRAYPGRKIDLVLDSAAAARQLKASAAALHPQVRCQFTLGSDIWLRLVDIWVQMMIRDGIDEASGARRQLGLLRAGDDITWIGSGSGSASGRCPDPLGRAQPIVDLAARAKRRVKAAPSATRSRRAEGTRQRRAHWPAAPSRHRHGAAVRRGS